MVTMVALPRKQFLKDRNIPARAYAWRRGASLLYCKKDPQEVLWPNHILGGNVPLCCE